MYYYADPETFCLYKTVAENYAQEYYRDKTQACKAEYENAVNYPYRKMYYQKCQGVYSYRQDCFGFCICIFERRVKKQPSEYALFHNPHKDHRYYRRILKIGTYGEPVLFNELTAYDNSGDWNKQKQIFCVGFFEGVHFFKSRKQFISENPCQK